MLRRIIRRAVLRAQQLGADRPVTADLFDAVRSVLGPAYPELERGAERITDIIGREEARFRQTLRAGSALLDEALESGPGGISGEVAFLLHDTHGFPVELTQEIAAERGVEVDMAGFEQEMTRQRERARKAGKEQIGAAAADERYRQLLDDNGPTEFLGYGQCAAQARILAVLERPDDSVEVFLDRTPFYAEGGGQVGDTGTITTATGTFEVTDTTYALPGLHRHLGRMAEGDVEPGQEATATVDEVRRDDIRRNHTGTHLLQWALREVLGDHVQQQGSLVAPDRLRFDFSHYAAPTPEELRRVEELVNEAVITNASVRAYETSMAQAQSVGAIAFFGDRYGEVVRVVEAGGRSVELCGGTHVGALGMIGPMRIVSEASIGANTRRIEAVTGHGALARIEAEEDALNRAAELLRSRADEVPDAITRLLERQKAADDELKAVRRRGLQDRAVELAADGRDGRVVARVDGIPPDQLRELALSVRSRPEVTAVVLGGSPDGQRAALVAAVEKDAGWEASDLLTDAARLIGGGGGRHPELATAGGKDPSRLDEALDGVRTRLAEGPSGG